MKSTTVAFLTVSLLIAGVFPAPAGTLSITAVYQEQDQWCWAGCSQMILTYYGVSLAQCSMANYAFSQSNCCNNVVWPDGTGSSCNQPNYMAGYYGSMADILSVYGGISGVDTLAPLTLATVTSEIDSNRPFLAGWSWLLGGGHVVVGKGYSGSYVYYNDPWPGEGSQVGLYSWMVTGGGHVWDESYRLTTSPAGSDYRVLAGGDYDGDGTCDIAIFRESAGLWAIRGISRAYYGTTGDIPVPGDYRGDGRDDISIFRPSTGLWSFDSPPYTGRIYFGGSGDTPVPADYNGDGTTDVGIYRASSGLWAITGITRRYFGATSDYPVPGPYAAGGIAEIGIFRPSSGLWALGSGGRVYFGAAGDIPVPGDYDDRGDWCIAIFRPSTGLWAAYSRTRSYFGGSSDQPVQGNYQGGSGDEIAIFRPSTGLWAINGGNRYYFGTSGDIPVTR